jgi:hypothetical protein
MATVEWRVGVYTAAFSLAYGEIRSVSALFFPRFSAHSPYIVKTLAVIGLFKGGGLFKVSFIVLIPGYSVPKPHLRRI